MRRLLPLPVTDDVDLDAAFWTERPGRQWVSAVMVSSADGAAQSAGRSRGLSGAADVALFARLRSHADVLLVGAGTARIEKYGAVRFTAERRAWRLARGLSEAPPLAIVSRSCALDPAGPLFTDAPTRPVVITCRSAPADRIAALSPRADVLTAGEQDVDLAVALDLLAARGHRRVSCEGGPTLLAQLAATGRLDELSLTLSPQLLAGPADRILRGSLLEPPQHLQLVQVLEDEGFLFCRYQVRTDDAHAAG